MPPKSKLVINGHWGNLQLDYYELISNSDDILSEYLSKLNYYTLGQSKRSTVIEVVN